MRPHDLFDLFTDQFLATACPLCGDEKSLEPSLVALSLNAHALIHCDRGAGQGPVKFLQRQFEKTNDLIAKGPFETLEAKDYGEFKSFVAARVKSAAGQFPNFSTLAPTDFASTWTRCEGEVFSAVAAAAAGGVPGTRVAFTDPDTDQPLPFSDVVELLKYRTIETVRLLAFSLTNFHQRTIRVEEYLLRLIETSPFVREMADDVLEAVSQAIQAIENANPEHTDAILWFQIYVIEASLHVFLGREYDNESKWADAFLKFQIVCHLQSAESDMSHLRISQERVRKTISLPAAFNATAKILTMILQHGMDTGDTEFVRSWLDALEVGCIEFGYPGLYSQAIARGIAIETRSDESADGISPTELAADLVEVSRSKGPTVAMLMLPIRLRACEWRTNLSELEILTDHLLSEFRDLPIEKANVLKWFAQQMKELNQPDLGLSKIGRAAADWEYDLPPSEKLGLWTERASALRLAGDREHAVSIARVVLQVALATLNKEVSSQAADISVAWMNLGIYLRETGQVDEAIECLSQAVSVAPENTRVGPLVSLGWTFLHSGRSDDATLCFGRARNILKSPRAGDQYFTTLIGESAALLAAGKRLKAEELISEIPEVARIPSHVLPQFGSIFSATWRRRSDVDKKLEVAEELMRRFEIEIAAALQSGNTTFAAAMFRSAALVAFTIERDDEERFWRGDAEICVKNGEPPLPITAISLARIDAKNGLTALLAGLATIQDSLRFYYGSVALDPETVSALAALDEHFDRLIGVIVDLRYEPTVLQLAASIRRNAHRQAIAARQTRDDSTLYQDIVTPDACCAAVAAGLATFAVLEWVDTDQGAVALVSVVNETGASVGVVRIPPDMPLFDVAESISARLLGWRASRKGEPFEVNGWQQFKVWLRGVGNSTLPDGGHIVVIDHARFSSLPYHIALAPEWTVSYAADWNSVLAAVKANLEDLRDSSFGLIFSPRANEAKSSLAAFNKSVARTVEHLQTPDRSTILIGEKADQEGLRHVLSKSSVAKIICHGQVSREHSDVALLVSHDGKLPPGYTFAASTKEAQPHRVGWREFSNYAAASRVIFLGACSSGKVQISGLDERISIFSSLSKIGTAAVVAPRWKIDVELALPVLDDAICAFLNGAGLAAAVQAAAAAAVGRGVPLWQAYAFVIEGAWQ